MPYLEIYVSDAEFARAVYGSTGSFGGNRNRLGSFAREYYYGVPEMPDQDLVNALKDKTVDTQKPPNKLIEGLKKQAADKLAWAKMHKGKTAGGLALAAALTGGGIYGVNRLRRGRRDR